MSKSIKRLSLKSETLRTLSNANLDKVAGGAASVPVLEPISFRCIQLITRLFTR